MAALVLTRLVTHEGAGGTTPPVTSVINFNGGSLGALVDSTDFVATNSAVVLNVKSGGAKFDTNGHAITINKPFLTDATSTGRRFHQGRAPARSL